MTSQKASLLALLSLNLKLCILFLPFRFLLVVWNNRDWNLPPTIWREFMWKMQGTAIDFGLLSREITIVFSFRDHCFIWLHSSYPEKNTMQDINACAWLTWVLSEYILPHKKSKYPNPENIQITSITSPKKKDLKLITWMRTKARVLGGGDVGNRDLAWRGGSSVYVGRWLLFWPNSIGRLVQQAFLTEMSDMMWAGTSSQWLEMWMGMTLEGFKLAIWGHSVLQTWRELRIRRFWLTFLTNHKYDVHMALNACFILKYCLKEISGWSPNTL